MDIFDHLDSVVSATCDTINETEFVFTPYVLVPNGRPGEDPDRSVVEGTGIFDYTAAEYGVELGVRKSYREANDLRTLQVGRNPLLSVDRKWFPSVTDEPKQGDRFSFPKKPDLPEFEVVSCRRDGLSRLEVQLVHMGSQA